MKKVRLKNDITLIGLGKVAAGTVFDVEKYNSRFVYVKINNCSLRLSVKEVEKVK